MFIAMTIEFGTLPDDTTECRFVLSLRQITDTVKTRHASKTGSQSKYWTSVGDDCTQTQTPMIKTRHKATSDLYLCNIAVYSNFVS